MAINNQMCDGCLFGVRPDRLDTCPNCAGKICAHCRALPIEDRKCCDKLGVPKPKEAAIVVDEYKVKRFVAELMKAGYGVTIADGVDDKTRTLKVVCKSKDISAIHLICTRLQQEFARRN